MLYWVDALYGMPFSPSAYPAWLHWLKTCPSTNTWAIAHLDQLHDGDVVFTPHQTAGKGRQGRPWHSPPGVLTASVVLEAIAFSQFPALSLAAGLAVIYAVEDLVPQCQDTLRLKWPNDVLLEGRKLAGILCEAHSIEGRGQVVVGIGLNRCLDLQAVSVAAETEASAASWRVTTPEDLVLAHRAISLAQVTASVPEDLELLERLRHYLLEAAGVLQFHDARAQNSLSTLLPALRSRDALLGQTITLDVGEECIQGQGVGIGDRGHLLLRLKDGAVQAFASGHISELCL